MAIDDADTEYNDNDILQLAGEANEEDSSDLEDEIAVSHSRESTFLY